jgi:pimeloyl-ACP methyl ester carboxylesterase
MSGHPGTSRTFPPVRPAPSGRPVRKDEIVLEERGLYVESWLPERRSRRRPLYLLHGELGGSWLWERYLRYFAQRGWEGHALNLRAHFWSETADFAELDFDSYLADAEAGLRRLNPGTVLVGHGMGGLLALKLAESHRVAGLVLLSPAMPAALRRVPKAHELRVPPRFRHELVGWDLPPEQLLRRNSDLTLADVQRIRHLMGAEAGAARRDVLSGIPVARERLNELPILVIGAGLDRQYPEPEAERLANWLAAEYLPFGAHSHYGLVVGEHSYQQVADAIRSFLEAHKL